MKRQNFGRWLLFTLGLAVALASSFSSLVILLNLWDGSVLLIEPSPWLIIIEGALLILAIVSCLVAAEIYWKYLNLTELIVE